MAARKRVVTAMMMCDGIAEDLPLNWPLPRRGVVFRIAATDDHDGRLLGGGARVSAYVDGAPKREWTRPVIEALDVARLCAVIDQVDARALLGSYQPLGSSA